MIKVEDLEPGNLYRESFEHTDSPRVIRMIDVRGDVAGEFTIYYEWVEYPSLPSEIGTRTSNTWRVGYELDLELAQYVISEEVEVSDLSFLSA